MENEGWFYRESVVRFVSVHAREGKKLLLKLTTLKTVTQRQIQIEPLSLFVLMCTFEVRVARFAIVMKISIIVIVHNFYDQT